MVKKLGITNERVRQIEANAIMKIRKSKYIKELAIYMSSPDHATKNIDEYRKLYNHKGNKAKKLKFLEY